MDMPTPCPRCGDVYEFNDLVYADNYPHMVCEDCCEQINDENNSGTVTDRFNNVIMWKYFPDDGLIEFRVKDDTISEWSCEDGPETAVNRFMEIWNTAQDMAHG